MKVLKIFISKNWNVKHKQFNKFLINSFINVTVAHILKMFSTAINFEVNECALAAKTCNCLQNN